MTVKKISVGVMAVVFGLACRIEPVQAQTASWVPVKLTRIARNVQHDPKGIWPDSDVPRTDILYGEYQSYKPRGTVEISMLIGGVCDSPAECPVRAVFIPKGSVVKQDLADGSDQVCASGDGIELKTDLTAMRGCNVPVRLNPIVPVP